MAAIQVNTRVPEVLLARIDSAASDEGRTKWILDACRMRLDVTCEHGIAPSLNGACRSCNPWMFSVAVAQPDRAVAKEQEEVGLISTAPMKPHMQDLRDICEAKFAHDLAIGSVEPPLCGKTWWENGEAFECLMEAGHREALVNRHGLRGMVRRLDD